MFRITSKPAEKPLEPIAVNSVQASQLLGVSEKTLYTWTRDSKIPHRRIGRRLLYSVETLKAFVAGIDLDTSGDFSDDSAGKLAGEPNH